MAIKTERYIRKPLYVDAVQVTPENFLEMAFWCGGSIEENEANAGIERQIDPGNQHIKVPVKNARAPRQGRAYVGDWILKSEHVREERPPEITFKVYTAASFDSNFDKVKGEIVNTPEEDTKPPEAICDKCGAPKGLQVVGESCNNNCGGFVIVNPRAQPEAA